MYFLPLFKDASYAKRIKPAKRRDALKGRILQRTRRVPGLSYLWKCDGATLCLYHGSLTLRSRILRTSDYFQPTSSSNIGADTQFWSSSSLHLFPPPVCNFCIERYKRILMNVFLCVGLSHLREFLFLNELFSEPDLMEEEREKVRAA